jgi:hypothetical protein
MVHEDLEYLYLHWFLWVLYSLLDLRLLPYLKSL